MKTQSSYIRNWAAKAAFAIAILGFAGTVLRGQERYGEIDGTVTDASGAVIPGATVTLTHKATNRVYTFSTGADGTYLARNLEPGHYSVRFHVTGFADYDVPDVNLLLGKVLQLNASMAVARAEQTIEVSSTAAPLIDMTGTTVANNISSEEFNRLPKGRTFQDLVFISPSVNRGEIEGGFQVNGASGAENQFNVDGISTTSMINGLSRQNAVFEFLNEVQVKTSGIEAEYGGALGGVINATTKSGGNAFHGDLHYYFNGNAISAGPVRRLLLDPATEENASFVQDHKNQNDQHEVGGSLGGYLVKDKLFFFSSISPRWQRRSNDYLFSDGAEPGTLKNKTLYMQAFNKISWDPLKRVRTNFSWLYSPTWSTGRLPAYNSFGNAVSTSLDSVRFNPQIGWNQPQSSYTADVQITATPTTLISLRGGYFYDNYKDVGIPNQASVTYNTTAIGLPFSIPPALQLGSGAYNIPRLQITFHDIATRAHLEADISKFGHFLGTHDLKAGWGFLRNINSVDEAYPQGGYVLVNWDRAFRQQRGAYGYYEIDDIGTRGSTSNNIISLYIQDKWRILPRLTLSLGLRTENERVPSMARAIQETAFKFGFGDKMAPRLGATLDVFGNGRLKLYGSWGRYFDFVKYDLVRGTFGGDFWRIYYRSLDTLDVFNLSGNNAPGRNLWTGGAYRDLRLPGFDKIDPNLKPLSTDKINAGVEFQLSSHTVFAGRYIHDNLRRTIEDMAALVNGNEDYYYVNPGEGIAKNMLVSGPTPILPTPKPKRTYDAMELTVSRRFSQGLQGSVSYVYSRLYGNYPGLGSSDEITTPTTGVTAATAQQSTGSIARPGTNASRAYDLDEYLWDAHGNLGNYGRLATDRPHSFKLYGSYTFKFGTEIGTLFFAQSGTPLSTYVTTANHIDVFVNGRGDMGRTPWLTQTDLLVAHEFKLSEVKRLRLEFNAQNLFNQKIARHRFNYLNRGAGLPRESSLIDLSTTDLSKGYDYRALILQTSDGADAYDPRYGLNDLFNPGFAGRVGIKFIF